MNKGNLSSGRKADIPNNIYTAILAASAGILLITILIVAIKCAAQYGSLFTITQ
jgi:hypothetical protein